MASTLGKWLKRSAVWLAAAYLVALVLVALGLRFVGERFWLTGVVLYLPRIAFAAPAPVIALLLVMLRLHRFLILPALSAVVVLFPLMGLVLPGGAAAEPGAPALRLLSYNINSAMAGEDAIFEQIERFSPDVVALQEIGWRGESLSRRFSTRYPFVRVSTQFLIASKFPIVSTREPETIPYYGKNRSPRFLQQVLETPLGKLALYNVHPLSPREGFSAIRRYGLRHEILSGRFFKGEHAFVLQANSGLREQQVKTFAEEARREPYPVIIAGDTNLPGLSPVLSEHLSAFQDAFTAASSGFGYTFPTNRKPWMRIDRVLGGPGIRFVGFRVGDSAASDHRCVVADLQRKMP